MSKKHFLGGAGKALLFRGNNLIGVATVLQESSLSMAISNAEVRGGAGDMLYGKYFYGSNLTGTLTNAMYSIDEMAAAVGTVVKSGGLSVKEEELVVPEMNGKVVLTETPVAFDGSLIGWFKKPGVENWTLGNLSGKEMTIPGAKNGEHYCVKYFYVNENAKSIVIKAQYVPAVLHVVLIHDLFAGEIADIGSSQKYGRVITDIPRFQLDGGEDLSLTSTSTATTSLSGSALAVTSGDTCEEDPYYATMTQEIYGAKWQDDVVALAVENADVDLEQRGTETLSVYAIFGNGMAPALKDNKNFTFAVESKPASTASGTSVGAHDGKITAGSQTGNCVISVKLDNGPKGLEPAYANVTVA